MGQDPGSNLENRNAEELPSLEMRGRGGLRQSAEGLRGLALGSEGKSELYLFLSVGSRAIYLVKLSLQG